MRKHAAYPWDRWLRPGSVRLEQGRDYPGLTHAMAQQVRNAACARKVSVSIRIAPDGKSLVLSVR